MSTTTIDVYLASSVSGDVTSPNNALGAPDGTYTTDTSNTNWTHVWRFGDPSTQWLDGIQPLTLHVRKDTAGGNDPTITSVTLFYNSVSVRTLLSSFDLTTDTADIELDFDASEVGDDGADLDIEISVSGAGGPPASRRTVQLDAITWEATSLDFQPGSRFQGWTGSDWVEGELHKWDGSIWVPVVVQRWTGSEWVEV